MYRMHKEQMPRENEAKKEEVATMIHRIDATVVFVRDLARCLTFYGSWTYSVCLALHKALMA